MKNLKDLIKPGYIVDIEDREDLEECRYIVVDSNKGLTFHSIIEPGKCIPLDNFNNDLINTHSSIAHKITVIYQLIDSSGSTDFDDDLNIIWKREILKLTVKEIAKKFNTTPENIKIIDNGN